MMVIDVICIILYGRYSIIIIVLVVSFYKWFYFFSMKFFFEIKMFIK